jgi:hypothetical protein
MISEVKADVVRKSLLSKGFQPADRPHDHERYVYFFEGRKTAFFFKISFGKSAVRQDEIKNSARQFRMRGDDLYRIVCCDYDQDQTRQVYRAAMEE